MTRTTRSFLLIAALFTLASCAGPAEEAPAPAPAEKVSYKLTEVATSERQWTGLAVAPGGRMFVSYPRWSEDVPVSVAELKNGAAIPYPDEEANSWTPDDEPGEKFVCAQSVVADEKKALWILDPASPGFAGWIEGAPKLIRYSLVLNRNIATYRFEDFDEPILMPGSYLNDVRIDWENKYAYLTDSGDGAIIVIELVKGKTRRLLDHHPSTGAEDIVLNIEGNEWLGPDGSKPQIHSDGIALSPDRKHLYYQALTGRTLYRVPTTALQDESLSPEALGAKVEEMGKTGAADGLMFGADGWLYITALEENAIKRFDPETRQVEVVVQDERIKWPDSFARDEQGRMHFTTAQIHLGGQVTEPYRLFRIDEVRGAE